VVKKYNVSVFTVYKQLRKDDWSAKPRVGPTKLKEEKSSSKYKKRVQRFQLELRLMDLEAHSQHTYSTHPSIF